MRTAPVSPSGAPAGRAGATALAAGIVSAGALFVLSRPYLGIAQDAVLYIGRAVADGDPDGLGRDILFAHDGQSRFSLFTALAARLVGWLGPEAAAWWLAHVALLGWFGGAAALASRFGRGRMLWAMLACAALASARYGGDDAFRFAEPYAIPRPLAEAAVLFGLAACLARRTALATLCFAIGLALHPIMASAGVAVAAGLLSWRDRRWLIVPAAGAILFVAAGLLGLPFASRLFATVDPAWSVALHVTSVTYPSLWPAETWSDILLQATVLLVAARAATGAARHLLVATVAVAVFGVAAATVGGEWAGSLLILQGQPWRPLWLLACLSALSLPLATAFLWRLGPRGQLALTAFAVAFLSVSAPVVLAAIVAALLALRWGEGVATPLVRRAAWSGVGVLAAVSTAGQAFDAADLWTTSPEGGRYLASAWSLEVLRLPATGAAIASAVSGRPRIGPGAASGLAAVLVFAALIGGDGRSHGARRLDAWRPDPALAARLAGQPGEVLWLRGGALVPWVLAGRPNWVSAVQGSSMLFSRDLAAVWSERTDRLLAAHLGDESDRSPNLHMAERRAVAPSRDDLARFCAAPDAPVLIVAPRDGSVRLPEGVEATDIRLPAPLATIAFDPDGRPRWSTAEAVATVPCRSR